MAFSVTVKSKKPKRGLFGKSKGYKIELVKILENCELSFGAYNDFYILEKGEMNDDNMILYNPKKIGRGIFLDFNGIGDNELTLTCNLPTTPSEIRDFFNIIREVKSQCKEIEIYFEGEKQDEDKFFNLSDNLLDASLGSLREACSGDSRFIQTLALFPYTFSREQLDLFRDAEDLKDYEELLHSVQNRDVYYTKPAIRQFPPSGEVLACYLLISNCESIFPLKGDMFLNFDEIEIDDSHINFFLKEDERLVNGIYKYDDFVEYALNNGAEYFDANHITVKMSKDEILEMLNSLQKI